MCSDKFQESCLCLLTLSLGPSALFFARAFSNSCSASPAFNLNSEGMSSLPPLDAIQRARSRVAKLWQALGRKAYCIELYELIRAKQRNHNPRVGGSSPSSATTKQLLQNLKNP